MTSSYHYLDEEALISLRKTYTQNLARLEERAAKYGSLSAPFEILNQIEEQQQTIEAIDAELATRALSKDPLGDQVFDDKWISNIVATLREKHRRLATDMLPMNELLGELNLLFDRNTFRFEALWDCADQSWGARFDKACQTYKVLQAYRRNVQKMGSKEQVTLYTELLREVSGYCIDMGAHLFEETVKYSEVVNDVGSPAFKARLPKEKEFPTGPDRRLQIPLEINDACEGHRLRAVEKMNKLYATIEP